jgi:hypothetical protein
MSRAPIARAGRHRPRRDWGGGHVASTDGISFNVPLRSVHTRVLHGAQPSTSPGSLRWSQDIGALRALRDPNADQELPAQQSVPVLPTGGEGGTGTGVCDTRAGLLTVYGGWAHRSGVGWPGVRRVRACGRGAAQGFPGEEPHPTPIDLVTRGGVGCWTRVRTWSGGRRTAGRFPSRSLRGRQG